MILLIGLDGWDYRWAGTLERAGYSVAPLHSPVPLSWVAWNTIGTGIDSRRWHIGGNPMDYMRFAKRGHSRPPYLWEIAGESGLSSLICNWPFVVEPRPFGGVLVCGYPALANRYVVPASERDRWHHEELDFSNKWTLATGGQDVRKRLRAKPPRVHLDDCKALHYRLARRFINEAQRIKPDFAFLGMMDCDRLSHYACDAMKEPTFLREALNSMMDALGAVTRELQPTCTIICSDHGLDLGAPARTGTPGYVTHSIHLPDSQTGVLALREDGRTLGRETAQQIDVAPMVLNRLGIDHALGGTDRSVPRES